MAKIHGFELKNMRSFRGMEGIGTEGDVWLNGKKLGGWLDAGDGGEARFFFPRSAVRELDRLVAEQAPEVGFEGICDADLSLLLSRLADLKDAERAWKRASRRGCALLVVGDGMTSLMAEVRPAPLADLGAAAAVLARREGLDESSMSWKAFMSAEDFDEGEPLSGAGAVIAECAAAARGV